MLQEGGIFMLRYFLIQQISTLIFFFLEFYVILLQERSEIKYVGKRNHLWMLQNRKLFVRSNDMNQSILILLLSSQ